MPAWSRFPYPGISRMIRNTIAGSVALVITAVPSVAGDPFRPIEAREIGDKTEEAFKQVFLYGDYPTAAEKLKIAMVAEPEEPLAYAMQASLAYSNKDIAGLETYSKKTLTAAKKLVSRDKLRGNLYIAVGHFLQGAVTLSREGTVSGAPQALSQLRQVYDHLDKAEAISRQDPELNLIKGYMDLMVAVNLPFADPEQAIARLRKNAAPQYLVDRGIAIAYRDLKKYDKALTYANKALTVTSENPELHYLKAQILREKAKAGKDKQMMRDAVTLFDKALAKQTQLPQGLVRQIQREHRNSVKELRKLGG